MKHPYLEVTYRKGRALAAYLYLPGRGDDCSARSERAESGLVVDFAEDGRPIGIEIPSPSELQLAELNQLLERHGLEPVRAEDVAPLVAA